MASGANTKESADRYCKSLETSNLPLAFMVLCCPSPRHFTAQHLPYALTFFGRSHH